MQHLMKSGAACALLWLCAPGALGSGGFVPFEFHASFEVPPEPSRMDQGDWDGDGDIDLVMGHGGAVGGDGRRVSVATNDGEGNFTFELLDQFVPAVFDVAFIDLDQDGTMEIAAAVVDSLVVYKRLGGEWSIVQTFELEELIWPVGKLLATDLDQDGVCELVVGNVGSGGTALYIMRSEAGLLVIDETILLGDADVDGVFEIVSADLEGDGIGDLIVTAFETLGNKRLTVLRDGSGEPLVRVSDAGGFSPLVVTDLDGDGLLDLINTLTELPGGMDTSFGQIGGDGRFEFGPPVNTQLSGGGFARLALADVDGDGGMELIGSGVGGIRVLKPTPEWVWEDVARVGWRQPSAPNCDTPGAVTHMATEVADFNGDGIADLAAAPGNSVLIATGGDDYDHNQLFISFGTGAALPERIDVPFVGGLRGMASGDFNGDGIDDVFVSAPAKAAVVLGGAEGPALGHDLGPAFATDYQPAAGDFDNDGDTDVVAMIGGARTMLLNDGAGAFTAAFSLDSPAPSIGAGDFNGDGLLDLVAQGALYLNDGQFETAWPNAWAAPEPGTVVVQPAGPIQLSVFDANGDGVPDVCTSRLYICDGAGAFAEPIPLGTFARAVGADIDADGDTDVVSALCPFSLYVQEMGEISTSPAGSIKAPWLGGENEPTPLGYAVSGDLDLDGVDDVVGGAPGFAVLYGRDDTFRALEFVRVTEFAAPPSGLALGDFNGDGVTDGAAIQSAFGSVVFVMGGATPVPCPADLDGSGAVGSTDLNILLADFGCSGGSCTGDVDGDGDTDSSDLNQLLAAFGGGCE